MIKTTDNSYKYLPETPGVYLMKNNRGQILYIGKAGNLRRRVSSYFERAPAFAKATAGRHDLRIEKLAREIRKIDYKKTDSVLEALILESELIKKHQPPFNIKEKDDKSFLYIEITNEEFPRVLLVRGKKLAFVKSKGIYGPFVSAINIREALKILRRIFPWSIHLAKSINGAKRPCFDYEIGLCPGTCIGAVDKNAYLDNIKRFKLFLEGKKKRAIKSLESEMRKESKNLEFEKAEKIKRQIFALKHIQDIVLISDSDSEFKNKKTSQLRIEGYDISDISGIFAVGSMVVFAGDKPVKSEYRLFKIRTIKKANDVSMLKEVLQRRFSRLPSAHGWQLPDLILIDGGKGQVNAGQDVLREFGLKIPIIGIAKGKKRNKNEFIGKILDGIEEKTLIKVRDEAHRFAINYHKKIRSVF
ncbi:MAG: GIY-YIG nuclease family protein [Patescibacteria group bacterium]|nr:GIY-YIG nuclease family protein [Patescibacteria group bacterium]